MGAVNTVAVFMAKLNKYIVSVIHIHNLYNLKVNRYI